MLLDIFLNIIKKKATKFYNYFIDDKGIYAPYFEKIDTELLIIKNYHSFSTIARKRFEGENRDKSIFYYSSKNVDISALVTTGKAQNITISVLDILNEISFFDEKEKSEINLLVPQLTYFFENFDKFVNLLKFETIINTLTFEKIIAKLNLENETLNIEDELISILKGNFNYKTSRNLGYFDSLKDKIADSHNISLEDLEKINNIFRKVLLTCGKDELKNGFPSVFNNELIDLDTSKKLMVIIKNNKFAFTEDFEEFSDFVNDSKYEIFDLCYSVPAFFKKYFCNNLNTLIDIPMNKALCISNETEDLISFKEAFGNFIESVESTKSVTFSSNLLKDIFSLYKTSFVNLDINYRILAEFFENFALSTDKDLNDISRSILKENMDNAYFDSLKKMNYYLINDFPSFTNKEEVYTQNNLFRDLELSPNTLIIISDAMTYNLAYEFIRNKDYTYDDYNLISDLPSETEVCYNSYFITDETVQLDDKNRLSLEKNGKDITYVRKWRLEKLKEIFGTAIDFDDFKTDKDYKGIVLWQHDEIDKAIHGSCDNKRLRILTEEVFQTIDYALERGFNILLLSDHGHIPVSKKFILFDDININKKKDRYLVVNKDENLEKSIYLDNIPLPSYVDVGDKKLAFINSVNSLKECGKYTHGGLSLQECILPCFYIKSNKSQENLEYIVDIEWTNKLKFTITNIKNTDENILDVLVNNKLFLNQEVKNGEKKALMIIETGENSECLIILSINDKEVVREYVKKKNLRKIHSDMNIF